MGDTVSERYGVRVFLCSPDGTTLRTDRDAVDVIGEALQHRADLVAIPTERLDDRFFTLGTRLAGEIMQKFVAYRLRLAIVGDITRHLDGSSALRALVYESNAGSHVWFMADAAELDVRLERAACRHPRDSGDPPD
jgi:hypothetical protein